MVNNVFRPPKECPKLITEGRYTREDMNSELDDSCFFLSLTNTRTEHYGKVGDARPGLQGARDLQHVRKTTKLPRRAIGNLSGIRRGSVIMPRLRHVAAPSPRFAAPPPLLSATVGSSRRNPNTPSHFPSDAWTTADTFLPLSPPEPRGRPIHVEGGMVESGQIHFHLSYFGTIDKKTPLCNLGMVLRPSGDRPIRPGVNAPLEKRYLKNAFPVYYWRLKYQGGRSSQAERPRPNASGRRSCQRRCRRTKNDNSKQRKKENKR